MTFNQPPEKPDSLHSHGHLLIVLFSVIRKLYLNVTEVTGTQKLFDTDRERNQAMITANNDFSSGVTSSVYLKSSGKLYDKAVKPAQDGLLCTLWNFPLRGYSNQHTDAIDVLHTMEY